MLLPNIRRAVTSPRQGGRRRVVQRTPIRDSHQPDGVGSPPPRTQHAPTPRGNKTLRANITIASLNINGGGRAQTKEKWQHINQLLRDKKSACCPLSPFTYACINFCEQLENLIQSVRVTSMTNQVEYALRCMVARRIQSNAAITFFSSRSLQGEGGFN